MPRKYGANTLVKASPEEIWPWISTLDGFKKWYIRDGRLDARRGGEFFQVWSDQVKTMCTVDEIVPNERFAFRWKWTIDTRIDIWLEPDAEGAYIHIEHGDFPDDAEFDEVFSAYQIGWTKFLMCLKAQIMHGVDIRDEWSW
jgi:uncharacterized protein YndB with AHSA1/START domain